MSDFSIGDMVRAKCGKWFGTVVSGFGRYVYVNVVGVSGMHQFDIDDLEKLGQPPTSVDGNRLQGLKASPNKASTVHVVYDCTEDRVISVYRKRKEAERAAAEYKNSYYTDGNYIAVLKRKLK
jgi:hypothetical protein